MTNIYLASAREFYDRIKQRFREHGYKTRLKLERQNIVCKTKSGVKNCLECSDFKICLIRKFEVKNKHELSRSKTRAKIR